MFARVVCQAIPPLAGSPREFLEEVLDYSAAASSQSAGNRKSAGMYDELLIYHDYLTTSWFIGC